MDRMTQEELDEIIRKHGLWLNNDPEGERANLSFMNLSGLDLHGVKLNYANLKGADLGEANLQNADLDYADLNGAYLCGANFKDASLRCVNIDDANLGRANFEGANIDFSSLPLWCGSFDFKADRRIVSQIAYHFCRIDCNDEKFIKARNSLLDLANEFHRIYTGDCKELKEIPLPSSE